MAVVRDQDQQALFDHLNRFSRLEQSDWDMLAPHLNEAHLSRQDFFAREGKRASQVAFVLEGNLRQFYTHDGEEKTTYFYFEGHLMAAYFSCLTGEPSLLSIEALTNCRLLRFSYQHFLQLFEQSHAWERIGRRIAEYLALGLEERMVGLLLLSPEERYLELLKSNKTKILERIPQQYIANYLGITPVSLSRIRQRMNRKE